MSDEKYVLSTVKSALAVLNLYFDHEELSATDVASLMGINRSTAFRFMVTLESVGFLQKTSGNKFRLGIRIFTLGQLTQSRMDIVANIHPFLVSVSEVTGETTNLSVWESATQVVVIDKSLSRARLKMDTILGIRHYAHHTAGGKAILASESDAFINNYLKNAEFPAMTPSSITTAKQLLLEIDQIRENGYAMEQEETEVGLSCIGVPLKDFSGRAYAAISTSGPTTRLLQNKALIIEVLKETAAKIQKHS